jgi:pyridoxine 5-phosphate synthase
VIELHTGAYAEAKPDQIEQEISRLRHAIRVAVGLGLRVNAGHGLHFGNVAPIAALEGIAELNIGHAIVAQAIFDGWETTIRNMKACMIEARLKAQRGALLQSPAHKS